ncbi:hypothetical protein [uncultured Tenacibaculum sp.]|uniref:hypothetical protein n=1 Tax=uncultured Tenacibaculum sp. TaxID=174713 RepID=UPI00261318D9|nr:hypothetical protein [uncultured Tenacibaculum sp.]
MKKQILNLGKALKKAEQKEVNGGMLNQIQQLCFGTGTGGASSEGYSSACIGKPVGTKCTINGYLAACSNKKGGFWYY